LIDDQDYGQLEDAPRFLENKLPDRDEGELNDLLAGTWNGHVIYSRQDMMVMLMSVMAILMTSLHTCQLVQTIHY
jgi:hypothetical protein